MQSGGDEVTESGVGRIGGSMNEIYECATLRAMWIVQGNIHAAVDEVRFGPGLLEG